MEHTVMTWLDIADRLKSDWGLVLFIAVSYSFTALFAISQVRANRLDRNYTKKRRLTKLETRVLAFVIGAPLEFLFCMLAGLEFCLALIHAMLAGALTPVVADLWINLLRRRGCHDQVAMFKVNGARRRETDVSDDTGDFTRL